MKKLQLMVVAMLGLFAIGAQAAFVDNRAPAVGGEITVAYKAITVEELLAELVPPGFAVEYMNAEIPRKTVTLNGKGTWEALVARTAVAAQVRVETLNKEKLVRLSLVSDTKNLTASSSVPLGKADAKSAGKAPTKMAVQQTEIWTVNVGDSLRGKLDEWCDRAGYRLEWSKSVDSGFILRGHHVFESDFRTAVADLFASIPEDLHLDVEVTRNKLVYVKRGKQ